MNNNQKLSEIFTRLATEYEQLGETYRARAYRNAALSIARHPTPILSGKQAQKEIKGIGKSISEKIDEYLRTGVLSKFSELESNEQIIKPIKSEKDQILELFEGIFGVGPATANKWYNEGYRTLEQLANVKKTNAQELGYYYYNQLNQRIPRNEMDLFADRIASIFSSISICKYEVWFTQFIDKFGYDLFHMKPFGITTSQYYLWLTDWLNRATLEQIKQQNRPDLNLLASKFKNPSSPKPLEDIDFISNCNKSISIEYMICGSYRRGLNSSGDIDILIKQGPNFDLEELVLWMTDAGLLIGNLSLGKHKYLGIGRLDDKHNARRIDLLIVKPESWAYATLYFTGSQKLNILMRNRAIELGLTLNEYGLFDSSGQSYPASNEQQIFEYLQLQYLKPEDRSID